MKFQTPSRFQNQLTLLFIITATLVGAWLRLANVGHMEYHGDEFATLRWTLRPISELLSVFGVEQNTTPFYVLFIKGWSYVFGMSSPLVLKSPSLIAGIVLIPLLFWLGRRWLDADIGSLAAIVAAFSGPLIMQSQNARVYSILILLAIVSMLLFVRALRHGTRRDLVWLSFANAAMITMWISALYVLLAQGVVLLLELLHRPRIRWQHLLGFAASYALSIALVILLHVKMLASILTLMGEWGNSPLFRFESFVNVFQSHHPVGTVFFLVCLVYGIWVVLRRNDAIGRLLVIWAVLPLCYYVLQRTKFPDWALARYTLIAFPAQFLLISTGLLTALRRLLPNCKPIWSLTVSFCIIIGFFSLNYQSQLATIRPSWPINKSISHIQELAEPGDLVTTHPDRWREALQLYPNFDLETVKLVDLIAAPSRAGIHRLFIISKPLPQAKALWSKHFQVDEIGTRPTIYLLRSPPLHGNENVLRELLRVFLLGHVEAADQGVLLNRLPGRHHQQLGQYHRYLGIIARATGDEEAYNEHKRLTRYHMYRMKQEREIIR